MTTVQSAQSSQSAPKTRRREWLWILLIGAAIWLVSAVVTGVTRDDILLPGVILVGSFLVPVATVVWAIRREGSKISTEVILLAFLLAGTVGVFTSALIEVYFLPGEVGTNASVGVIEETCKGLIVLAIAHWFIRTRSPREGLVLGAVVGAGFSAFESAGYAMAQLLTHVNDHPVINIIETEWGRMVLAPFAHITWTALFGGALFYAADRRGHFRVTRGLFGTFIGIVVLHGFWDASYGLAIQFTTGVMGDGWHFEWPNIANWVGSPTGNDLTVFNIAYEGMMFIVGAIGVLWVIHRYRFYGRHEHADQLTETGAPASKAA